jgi:peptidoglycan/LPS O-acetylase OafA/YrhL
MNLSTSAPATQSSLIRPYYPALDGLRGVAFLMVFSLHDIALASSASILKWGFAGVDLFFVLSGFLITGILYDSLDRNHFFSNFYARRALRIWPLFYGLWLLLLLLTPFFHFI